MQPIQILPSSQAAVSTIDAQIEAAKVNVWRTTQDYNRYANLIKDHSITQQQYEQALAAKQTAERQLQVLKQQKNQASQQTNAVASQSNATSSANWCSRFCYQTTRSRCGRCKT